MVATVFVLYALCASFLVCLAFRSCFAMFTGYKQTAILEVSCFFAILFYGLSCFMLSFWPGTKDLVLHPLLLKLAKVFFVLWQTGLIFFFVCALFLALRITECKKKRLRFLASLFLICATLDLLFLLKTVAFPSDKSVSCNPVFVFCDNLEWAFQKGKCFLAFCFNQDFLSSPHLLFVYILVLFLCLFLLVFALKDNVIYATKYIVLFFCVGLCILQYFFFKNIGLCTAPFVFTFACAVIHFFVMESKTNLYNISTRNMTFLYNQRPYIFFDQNQKFALANRTALLLFPCLKAKTVYNLTIKDFFFSALKIATLDKSLIYSGDIELATPRELLSSTRLSLHDPRFRRTSDINPIRIFNVHLSPQEDKKNRLLGYFLSLDDQTDMKKAFVSVKNVADIDQNSSLYTYYSLKKKIQDIDLHDYLPYTAIACTISGLKFIELGVGRWEVDSIIRLVAGAIKSTIRASDFACFYNDQIVILLPESASVAQSLIKRIINQVEKFNSTQFSLSIEYGIYEKKEGSYSMDKVILYAQDQMLSHQSQLVHDIHAHTMLKLLGQTEFEPLAHLKRLEASSCDFAKFLGLSPQDTEKLKNLALFHDIGKLSTPKDVFLKQSKFTPEDRIVIGICSTKGYRIALATPMLNDIALLIYTHNERFDGTGRPNGVVGKEIPYLSRVFALLEAYDVMTHDAPYKKAKTKEQAIKDIQKSSGSQFDGDVTQKFLDFIKQ